MSPPSLALSSKFYKSVPFENAIRLISTLQSTKGPCLMIASIGNPEPEYAGTRHNVGHWFLSELVESSWNNFRPFSVRSDLPYGEYSSSTDCPNMLLFKSNLTLMNIQGKPVSKVWQTFKNAKGQENSPSLVIVHDEIQIPLGKIQVRKRNTSARGHNGLRSISSCMGQNYTKICIGIGKPNDQNVAHYVLSKFNQHEEEKLYESFQKFVSILEDMREGKYVYEVHNPKVHS
ncbi:uncharacterized protein PRCAT00002597001 [Priceomyces carsonii]|uniref:uncharacterized protein n=1 Tax=Priceomyces carsonii TaxID=28549 RepID=UPI002ED970A2|nr:unnamed protein product [Priceomyces carsonii]